MTPFFFFAIGGYLVIQGGLSLGHALGQEGGDGFEGLVRDGLSRVETLPFLFVLDQAQPLHLARGGDQRHSGPRQVQICLVREMSGFECDPPGPELLAGCAERGREAPRVERPPDVGDLVPGLLDVASVGKEDPAVCGHDELAIGAAEPGEVAHVGLARDQESFGLHPRERIGYPASPQRMVHDRAPRYETYLFEERQRLNAWSPKVKFAQLPLIDTSLKLPAKLPPGATVYTWPSTSTCTF